MPSQLDGQVSSVPAIDAVGPAFTKMFIVVLEEHAPTVTVCVTVYGPAVAYTYVGSSDVDVPNPSPKSQR
jgi:hypothetical protein